MTYHISRKVDLRFDEAVKRVTELLKQEGFGRSRRLTHKPP